MSGLWDTSPSTSGHFRGIGLLLGNRGRGSQSQATALLPETIPTRLPILLRRLSAMLLHLFAVSFFPARQR
ncbi:hypothetical protein XELAEV_18004567mg [Xenopus laevis]|uniref:Uncharacterized protein n=1 Tax=Xenopus laevis TaxID=8355 RepID=A0A974BR83_XENLA|nr:hypothetical protein XELAEV_18004567mg [Xenopus laevis]